MSARVALLRAVNVGGRNRIPMAELRTALEAAGLKGVSTVLQSGNVVFDAAGSEAEAAAAIQAAIAEAFGLDVRVVVKTAAEMHRIVDANPFLADGPGERARHRRNRDARAGQLAAGMPSPWPVGMSTSSTRTARGARVSRSARNQRTVMQLAAMLDARGHD